MVKEQKAVSGKKWRRRAAYLALVPALALVIAWGASSYYGERRTGQDALLPENSNIITYSAFEWEMDDPSELILDGSRLARPEFDRGLLRFTCVSDTFLYFNLAGQKLSSSRHFLLYLNLITRRPGGRLVVYLTQDGGGGRRHYVSESIRLPEGEFTRNIDLHALRFYLDIDGKRTFRWGSELTWADGLRLDFDRLEGTSVTINSVRFRPGMTLEFSLNDLWDRCQQEGLGTRRIRGLRIAAGNEHGTLTTPPLGIGTISRFHDMVLIDAVGRVTAEIRSGSVGEDGEMEWGDWMAVADDGDVSRLPARPFVQIRFVFEANEQGIQVPRLAGFRLRYVDPTPPGLGGPLFGTAHMPTYLPGSSITNMLDRGSYTVWIRLPLTHPRFDEAANRLIAHDVNLVGSIDFREASRSAALEALRLYRGRIAVWEVTSRRPVGAPFYTEFFADARRIDREAIFFPERVGPDYFQRLALRGQYRFATAAGTQEEVLNRGFWWFFVLALLCLVVVAGLGPLTGYHFKVGCRELVAGAAALAACAAILMPAILATGLAGLAWPRDWSQIEIAFNRYVVSAFLQEFVRALLLLLPVGYLVRAGVRDRTAWITVLAASSVLFGLGHLGYPGLSPAEVLGFVVVTTLAGLIFGTLFYATRSLTAVVIIHLIANIFLSTMTDIGPRL